jgi:hypothetical protein
MLWSFSTSSASFSGMLWFFFIAAHVVFTRHMPKHFDLTNFFSIVRIQPFVVRTVFIFLCLHLPSFPSISFLFFLFPSPPFVFLFLQQLHCHNHTITQRKENNPSSNPSLSVTYANEKLGINNSPKKPNSWRLLYFCLSSFFSLRKPFPSAGFVSLGILRAEIGGKVLLFGLELGL